MLTEFLSPKPHFQPFVVVNFELSNHFTGLNIDCDVSAAESDGHFLPKHVIYTGKDSLQLLLLKRVFVKVSVCSCLSGRFN